MDGAPGEFAIIIQDTGSDAATYTDSTVEAETSYVYRVLAINPNGVSEPSHDVEVLTTAPVGPQEPLRTEPANVSEGGTDCPSNTSHHLRGGHRRLGHRHASKPQGTVDWFKLELEAGTRYQIDMEGADTGQRHPAEPGHGVVSTMRSGANLIVNQAKRG